MPQPSTDPTPPSPAPSPTRRPRSRRHEGDRHDSVADPGCPSATASS
ncbi:hypothetical protein NKG05_19435 [Oerskovia sp. M15]